MRDELDGADGAAVLDLLDPVYYRTRYAGMLGDDDPEQHFLQVGWKQGFSPNPGFDPAYYLEAHPDVADVGYNPVLHYARFGRSEGRAASPLPLEIRALLTAHFDAAYYLANNPDLTQAAVEPLTHFYTQGWREGRNPRADFDVAFYRRSNPDLATNGINPFLHYVLYGRAEGRRSRPSTPLDEQTRGVLERHFDGGYYLETYADIRAAGIDPLLHFHETGWREGRNPSREFDVPYYLGTNPDVAEAGMNPLLHYSLAGEGEGRAACRPLDAARRQIEAAVPPATRSAGWISRHAGLQPLEGAAFAARMMALSVNASVVVSISHDHYRTSVGGVQNLILDEAEAFEARGSDYLHLSPAAPSLALAPADDPAGFLFFVELNRLEVGVVTAAVLAGWLEPRATRVRCVVHHLMGHDPDAVLLLLAAARAARPIIWAHDFFAACPSYALMRNDVAFCGGPPPDSAACTICCYGADRSRHLSRMATFFAAADAVLVAPSQAALDRWIMVAGLHHARALVAPLASLRRTEPVAAGGWKAGDPIRVAHLGGQAFHKGWAAFEELARRFRDDPRYRFYRLGRQAEDRPSSVVQAVEVVVGATNRDAMISALAAHRIDVVVNWALWPETFNFTTYEALAAGAFVVTRRQSGNVWRTIETLAPDQGCALEDQPALIDLFAGEGLAERLMVANRRRGVLVLHRGSAELDEEAHEPVARPPARAERQAHVALAP